MKKYCKIIDEDTKAVRLGAGVNDAYYVAIGMKKREVEQAYTGSWYLKGYAPAEPVKTEAEKTKEELLTVEMNTGLTRALREVILSGGVEVSEYLKTTAQKIEDLAETLRGGN